MTDDQRTQLRDEAIEEIELIRRYDPALEAALEEAKRLRTAIEDELCHEPLCARCEALRSALVSGGRDGE